VPAPEQGCAGAGANAAVIAAGWRRLQGAISQVPVSATALVSLINSNVQKGIRREALIFILSYRFFVWYRHWAICGYNKNFRGACGVEHGTYVHYAVRRKEKYVGSYRLLSIDHFCY
jgi:hypothetical protein